MNRTCTGPIGVAGWLWKHKKEAGVAGTTFKRRPLGETADLIEEL